MHFLGLIVLTIAKIFELLIHLYTFIVAASVILSWVNPDPYNPIVRFLYQVTQPVLQKIRRILPRSAYRWGFDPSPVLLFIILIAVETIFVGMLFQWAGQLLGNS